MGNGKLGRRRRWRLPKKTKWSNARDAIVSLAPTDVEPGDELVIDLTKSESIEPYILAVVAAQAEQFARAGVNVSFDLNHLNPSNRFATALGLRVYVEGQQRIRPIDATKTIPISSIRNYAEMDAFVDEVCDRLEITDGEIRRATKYSQVELIRNVFDHSGSKPTVCAQLITGAHGRPKHGSVQVAVADAGVGLLGSFGSLHPWVETDSIAIETALEPHISSTFLPGERAPDGANNAGLGLHFVSELVKRSDGRMLVWSGSHALAIIGDETMKEGFRYSTANAHRLPGTLVVVEYEVGTIHDYATVVEDLRDETSALYELTSDKEVVEIDTRPTTAVIRETRIHALLREDTSKARSYREQYLLPRIRRGDVEYSLSFQGYDALSPSFAHALLYAPIRAAALGDQKIYVRDASPGVWSSIKRVERYCLGTRLNQ